MKKYTDENIILDLENLINNTIEDYDLRLLLIDFLYKNKSEFSPSINTLGNQIYHISAFIQFIFAISLIKEIDDLNWDFLCYIYNNFELCQDIALNSKTLYNCEVINRAFKARVRQKNSTGVEKSYYFLSEFYKYVYDVKKYDHLQNIKEIGYYYNNLVQLHMKKTHKLTEKETKDADFYIKKLYSSFPIGSRYSDIISITKSDNSGNKNYNIPGSNIFIKNTMSKFLNNFTSQDNRYTTRLRIFLYFFSESCDNNIPNSLIDFNDNLFKIQFDYFNNLGSKHEFIKHDKRDPLPILLYFYRYIGNLSNTSNETTGLSKQLLNAFEIKNFIKYYSKGYKFIYHNKLEQYPSSDKVCLLPSLQSLNNASSENARPIYYDVSDIDSKYREDVKNFLWNNDGNIRVIANHLCYLKSFFKKKELFDIEYVDFKSEYELSTSEFDDFKSEYKLSTSEFDDEFLSYYRNVIELDYPNSGAVKSILKIIRKYLKFHRDKYNVTTVHLDILNLKNLENRKCATVITDHDIDVIYKEFEKLEEGSYIRRLQTLVFEIFIRTSLRIGSILNLTRDCLDYDTNDTDGATTLRYLSKTSNKEYISELINPPIVKIIEEALNLTESFVSKSNCRLNNYIFVHEYHSNHKYNLKRLDFYHYFKDIVDSLSDQLDCSNYYPYNIRHTYINNTFKNGTKLGMNINDLSAITNISYKTANLYYRDFKNDIDLYVEAVSKVRFNDVTINGEIICNENENKNNNDTRPVNNDLGDCKSSNCILDSGNCLSCDSFVTFLNRIPQFEEAILNCDSKIEGTDNPLVKKFYITQKKLLAAYLAEMIRLDKKRGN